MGNYSNWDWKKIWEARDAVDFEFDADQRVLSALGNTRSISEEDAVREAMECGYSENIALASIQRLLWCGALRYAIFSPPKIITFRVSGKPARRRPLNGKIFRPPYPEPRPDDRRFKNNKHLRIIDGSPLILKDYHEAPDAAPVSFDELKRKLSPLAWRVAMMMADGCDEKTAAAELGISNRKAKKAAHEIRNLLL